MFSFNLQYILLNNDYNLKKKWAKLLNLIKKLNMWLPRIHIFRFITTSLKTEYPAYLKSWLMYEILYKVGLILTPLDCSFISFITRKFLSLQTAVFKSDFFTNQCAMTL